MSGSISARSFSRVAKTPSATDTVLPSERFLTATVIAGRPFQVEDSRISSVVSTMSATSDRGIVPPPGRFSRKSASSPGSRISPSIRTLISSASRVMCPTGTFRLLAASVARTWFSDSP